MSGEESRGRTLHYVVVAGLIVGMTGFLLSASLQAWSLVVMFSIGLAFLLYVRTEYDEVFSHAQ